MPQSNCTRAPQLLSPGSRAREPGLQSQGAAAAEPRLQSSCATAAEPGLQSPGAAATEPGLQSPGAAAAEPAAWESVLSNPRRHRSEKPAYHMESSLRSPQLEISPRSREDPAQTETDKQIHIYYKKKKKKESSSKKETWWSIWEKIHL